MDVTKLADWNQIATLAGAAGVVAVIVGYLKRLTPWLQGSRTLLLVWLLSLVICLAAATWEGSSDAKGKETQAKPFLAVINSFLVAATAAGVREGQRNVRGLDSNNSGRAASAKPSQETPEEPEEQDNGDDSD